MKISEALTQLKCHAKDSFKLSLEIWRHSHLEDSNESNLPVWQCYSCATGKSFNGPTLEVAVKAFCAQPDEASAVDKLEEQLSDLPKQAEAQQEVASGEPSESAIVAEREASGDIPSPEAVTYNPPDGTSAIV